MSKRAKHRARRAIWLQDYASGVLPFQQTERFLDAEHMNSLRERGLITEPSPKKPVEQPCLQITRDRDP